MIARRIYLASSWRNEFQPEAVQLLRQDGHEVYDFRNPGNGNKGFSWSEIDPLWKDWDPKTYISFLKSAETCKDFEGKRIQQGFQNDYRGMLWCDTGVLLLPCGRSAHLETGWIRGTGRRLFIYVSDKDFQPDLMYLLADVADIHHDFTQLRERLKRS